MRFKNFARKDSLNDAQVLYQKSETEFTPFYTNSDIQGPVYVVAKTMARNPFGTFGPLTESWYISGFIEFTDNSDTYNVYNGSNWEVNMPFYILPTKEGEDIIKLSHKARYNGLSQFKQFYDEKAVGPRLVSKIDTYFMLIDPESGAQLKNYDRTNYEGWEVNLSDFKSKSAKFMFNIFYRPTYKWYRNDNNKSFNHLLTIRHSWVCSNTCRSSRILYSVRDHLSSVGPQI
jgi:hypothetical protein